MASAALFDPTLHAAYYQHRWASQKENGVLVCVRDVLRFKRAFPALFEAGAVRLYRHAQWPCVYATIVATVVAVREAEGQTEYTGTCVGLCSRRRVGHDRRAVCADAEKGGAGNL